MVLSIVLGICLFACVQADECSSTMEATTAEKKRLITKDQSVNAQDALVHEALIKGRAAEPEGCKDLGSCWLSLWCTDWQKLHCCDCGGGYTMIDIPNRSDQDLLSVMTYNTHLLRINFLKLTDTRPNLAKRADEISNWFTTLRTEEVPDVLVFQEIYANKNQSVLNNVCNKAWRNNSGRTSHLYHKYIPCDVPNSPFGFATACVNPTSWTNPVKTGGVVVLLKKGLQIVSAEDVEYDDCAGQECGTDDGFWAIKLQKGKQVYWAFATHAIASEDPQYIEIRQKQFQQMRRYIDSHVEDGARLVIAGDMNIFTGPYRDKDNVTYTPTELETMLANLGVLGSPAIAGDLVPKGFWLPLVSDMKDSADPKWNHIINAIPNKRRLGAQRFDSVIAPGQYDRLTSPMTMRFQIAPVKSEKCFVTEQDGYPAGTKTDDLSDHYAVFAELRYSPKAPNCTVVHGHQGSKNELPAGPTC